MYMVELVFWGVFIMAGYVFILIGIGIWRHPYITIGIYNCQKEDKWLK